MATAELGDSGYVDFACAAAALNCTAPGARGGIQSVEDIEKLVASGARIASAFGVSI
jgi:sulfofructose kinase